MEQHVLIRQHSRQQGWQSSFDVIRKKWAQKCLSVHTAGPQLPSAAPGDSSASSAPVSSAGWALKQQAKAKRFSQQVRSYLEELFKVGQQSGIKVCPRTGSKGHQDRQRVMMAPEFFHLRTG